MKFLLSALLLLTGLQVVRAQVSGKIMSASGEPVAFANALLLNTADSSIAKAALSDEQGIFLIRETSIGSFILRVSRIGHHPWESALFRIDAAGRSKDFGTIVLKKDTVQLATVVVKSLQPAYRQTPQGLVIDAGNSLMTKGSTALQVLERLPGVLIDRRNGDISLNGKNGVTVMVDGKAMRMSVEQVLSLLNGMSGDNVEKVELLNSPSAKYDAEGAAGMINIILKKNSAKGTTGNFSVTGGYGWREKAGTSVNIARNTEKFSVYGSYSFLHDRSYSNMYVLSSQDMPAVGGQLKVDVWDTTRSAQNNHDASAGIDIRLDPKTTVGGSIRYNNSLQSSTDLNHLHFTILPDSLLFYHGTIQSRNTWRNWLSSLYVQRRIRDGERINVSFDYLHFNNGIPSAVKSTFLNSDGSPAGNNNSLFSPVQKGFANTVIQVAVIRLDYSKQLTKKISLEAGAKGTYTRNVSKSGIMSLLTTEWVTRDETISNILMKEGIGAAYGSLNAQINQSTKLMAGVRYEYATTLMNNPGLNKILVERKLGTLFPGISISRKINEEEEFQFSWNKRISRPSYNDLASFVRYSDPTAVYTGNPLLKPTISNNVKLSYLIRRLTFSLMLSKDEYPIARYQLLESPEKNLLYVSPQNLSYQNNFNLMANMPVMINENWNMSFSFTGGIRQFRTEHTKQPVKKSYGAYSAGFNQSFALPRQFSAEISGWYNSLSYNGTVRVRGFGSLNAGLKKQMKNGGNLQVAVSDILRTMRIHSYFGTITQEAFSINNHVDFNTESRRMPIIRLTYSRSFGNNKSKPQLQTGIKSPEEVDRVRKD